MTSVVVIADVHVVITDTNNMYTDWGYIRLMKLAERISKHPETELWVLGDLFDKATPSMFDILAVSNFVKATGKVVKVLEGNHERVSNKIYTLHTLQEVIGVTILPRNFVVEDVSILAVGHDSFGSIPSSTKTDVLLSHFRWSHQVFGKGELPKKQESIITSKFGEVILGDIHYAYTPEPNVTYVSSPYSINFSSSSEYSMLILSFDRGKLKITREYLHLPCKVSLKLTFPMLASVLKGLDKEHMYRLLVTASPKELELIGKVVTASNVEIIGVLDGNYSSNTEIKVNVDLEVMLIDSLDITKAGKKYIQNIIK